MTLPVKRKVETNTNANRLRQVQNYQHFSVSNQLTGNERGGGSVSGVTIFLLMTKGCTMYTPQSNIVST
jgi:hypothetical protein